MPMVVIVFVLVGRAGMNKIIERGASETEAKADQSIAQNASQIGVLILRVLCERGQVLLGENPDLVGKAGRKWANHDKPRVLGDDPLASTRFFAYQVTKNAPPVCLIVSFRRRDLLESVFGYHRERDQLRMRMLESRASLVPLVLVNEDVAEPAVASENHHSSAIGAK